MTELIWDGKYDAAGQRTAPLRLALPFQTVETPGESAQLRPRALDLASGLAAETIFIDKRNHSLYNFV
jgi:hypothetical protein